MSDTPRIVSRQNAIVGRFRAAARGDGGLVLLDGEHLLADALDADLALDTVAVTADRQSSIAALVARVRATRAQVVEVSRSVLDAMSPVRSPSAVVALARLAPASIEQALAGAAPLVVVLGGVQDAGNVGAIVRAAEAFGATGVICAAGTADPFGWKALRGSMGSALRLPVAAGVPIDTLLDTLRARGLRVLGAAPRGGTSLPAASFREPTALVLGAEGTGLGPEVSVRLDDTVTISMAPGVESVNVAVAAAVILYEASRQRSAP